MSGHQGFPAGLGAPREQPQWTHLGQAWLVAAEFIVSIIVSSSLRRESTNREVVNVGGKRHHDRGGDTLLQQAAQLALGVDLGAEGRHAEVIFGTNGGDALLLQTTTHQAAGRGNEAKAQVNTGLDLVGESSPV